MDMDILFSQTGEQVRDQLINYRESLKKQLHSLEGILGDDPICSSQVYDLFTNEVAATEAKAYEIRQGIGVSYTDILPEQLASYGTFSITEANGCYHIVFDRLLQKRITNLNVKSDSYIAVKEAVIANYKYNLIKNRKNISIQRFECPIWLVFRHHYKSERESRDYDNFEYKTFIDTVIVGGGFVYDDSPHYISHLSCSCYKDQQSYTEVFVGPLESILKIKGDINT